MPRFAPYAERAFMVNQIASGGSNGNIRESPLNWSKGFLVFLITQAKW